MTKPKTVTMIAITRVGQGGGKTALPGQEFEIAENEVSRLETLGAATRKPVVESEVPKNSKASKEPEGAE